MKIFALFCMTLGLLLSATTAQAADGDDFGSTYFTATAPDALRDDDGASMLAVTLPVTDMSIGDGETLSLIEPAAGGESIFLLPDEDGPETEAGILSVPEMPIIPGSE